MPGKWTKFKGKLPEGADVEPAYAQKLDVARERHAGLSQADLIARYLTFDVRRDELQEEVKAINVELEALNRLLVERFEAEDLTSVKTVTGETLFLNVKPCVSVADREALYMHVELNPELHHLWSIHPQSLTALVKDCYENGREADVPPGVAVFLKTQVRIKRS